MRTLLVSPFSNGLAASKRSPTTNTLSRLGEVKSLIIPEARWKQTESYGNVELHACSRSRREIWQDCVARWHNTHCKLVVFNFLGCNEALAIDTAAVCYLASFSWPDVYVLVEKTGNNHLQLLRDLLVGAEESPPIFHSAEELMESLRTPVRRVVSVQDDKVARAG